jgi:D-cysteine desulfhydrase
VMPPRIPRRISLGSFPTRIQFLRRWTEAVADQSSSTATHLRSSGPRLYVKRDDETGADLSGNKVRKLEFLLADALARRADLIVTCGGVQSNHCRATAIAARRLGMDSLLFLRGTDPGERDGNLLLAALVGAELRFITPEEYARRGELMAVAAAEAGAHGRRPYVIPEGGSNALGSFGYLTLIDELIAQGSPEEGAEEATREPGSFPWDHIVCATGSGGTLAGLLLGVKLHGLPCKVWGVNVCDNARYFEERALAIAEEFRGAYLSGATEPDGVPSAPLLERSEVRILEGYKGPGYALPYPAMLDLVREVARRDGLFLDPVYTGKAFYGLLQEARRGRFPPGDRVLFLHTGGIFSLFPYRGVLVDKETSPDGSG